MLNCLLTEVNMLQPFKWITSLPLCRVGQWKFLIFRPHIQINYNKISKTILVPLKIKNPELGSKSITLHLQKTNQQKENMFPFQNNKIPLQKNKQNPPSKNPKMKQKTPRPNKTKPPISKK